MNIQGFKEFVADQPEGREITHHLWEHCAVGDYIKSLDNEFFDLNRVDTFVDILRNGCRPLYDCLNHNGYHAKGKAETYGQLHDFIGTL